MSNQVTKSSSSGHVQQQQASQHVRDVETREHHSKASASAGLNLNIFGALSGAFSSKSKKTTHTNADGSSVATEDRHDQGLVNAAARGQGSAYAAADAEQRSIAAKGREVGKEQKAVEGKKRVDHLGIEA